MITDPFVASMKTIQSVRADELIAAVGQGIPVSISVRPCNDFPRYKFAAFAVIGLDQDVLMLEWAEDETAEHGDTICFLGTTTDEVLDSLREVFAEDLNRFEVKIEPQSSPSSMFDGGVIEIDLSPLAIKH